MQILAYPPQKRALQDLNSDADIQLPSFLSNEVVPIDVGVLDKIIAPLTPRIWNPRSMTNMAVRVAVGLANLAPEAGVFTLTFDGDETAPIAFDADAGDIESALDLLASVIAVGGVTVTGSAGFFFITFNTVGDQVQITSDGDGLAPLTIAQVGTILEGTVDVQEIQTLRLFQNAAAVSDLVTNSSYVTGTIDVLRVGGGGFNAKVRASFSPAPYDGVFTLTIDGNETGPINYNASADEVLDAIEDVAGVGNATVNKEGDSSYVIIFVGALANTAVTVTMDDSGLLAVSFKTGFLDFRTAGVQVILDGAATADAYFEITGENPGEDPQVLYRATCTLVASVIDPETLANPPTLGGGITLVDAESMFPTFLPAVVAATGGGPTALDGISTAGWVAPRIVTFVEVATGGLKEYLYHSGTAASDPPLTIRPVDYAAGTHEYIFTQIA